MSFKSVLKNFIYSESWTCNLCGREIFSGNFCESCEKSLPYIGDIKCEHCGRKTVQPVKYCSSCFDEKYGFDKAVSIFEYKEPADKLIKSLKYGGNKYLAHLLAAYMHEKLVFNFPDVEVISYIPCTAKRYRERGFNQSELLAKELSALSGIKEEELLLKVMDTPAQAGLNSDARRKNLVRAFKVKNPSDVKDKMVLLIDDVMTTGSTVMAAAERLKKAGAASIYVMTVASVSKER